LKTTFITIVLCFSLFLDSYGREGKKLYSIGSNSAWNSSGTWSLTSNGVSALLVPQSDDTLIIDRSVVQNVNFTFNENGLLIVLSNGLLRGESLNLYFKGNSALKCSGEVKSKNINFTDNSLLFVENKGIVSVNESLTCFSANTHFVNGKLLVTGTLIVNESVKISGTGSISAWGFEGRGNVFSINDLAIIPDGSLVSEVNWIGGKNSEWNETANWTGGIVPKSNSNVSVLASQNDPTVLNEVYCNNLNINSSADLTVAASGLLTVNGNLAVIGSGKLLLKNTIAQKSSLLINGEVAGKIQSEYPVVAGKNHFISSPVSDSPSGVFINMYLRSYNEAAAQWGEYIVPTNTVLQEMRGYELYSLSNQVRLFEGVPNVDSKSFPITNSGDGLNLAGNPFPCYIDWENNDNDAWQRNSIGSAIYYPDPSGSGNYAVYLPGGDDAVSINNGSRYIAPMQGFFVKAEKAGVITVGKSSRVNNKAGYQQSGISTSSIKVELSKNTESCDEVLIRVNPNSSFGFDRNMDAIKLPGNTGASWLYTTSIDETQYSVNTIPTINSSLSIPVSIVCAQSGTYTISVSGALNFEYRYPVYLKDKILNTYIDLRQDSSYTFYHTSVMNKDRFEVYFNSPLGIEDQVKDNSRIIILPGSIEVSGNENEIYTASLFSIDGKLLSSEKGLLSDGILLSTSNHAVGICILKLSNGIKTITKKVYLYN